MASTASSRTIRDAAGVLVIARNTALHPGRPILLGQRSKNVRAPLTWAPWGGQLNAGEELHLGAIRELREESGYDGSIELIPESHWPDRYGIGPVSLFTFHNFLGVVEDQFVPRPDVWEVADARWFSLDEVDALPAPGWFSSGQPGGIHRGLRAYLGQGHIRTLVAGLTHAAGK